MILSLPKKNPTATYGEESASWRTTNPFDGNVLKSLKIVGAKGGELIINEVLKPTVKVVRRGSRAGDPEYEIAMPDGSSRFASAYDVVPPNTFLAPGQEVVLNGHTPNGVAPGAE